MVFSQEILTEIPNEGVEKKDILMELPPERVDQFCEVLKADWPLSIHAYYFIKIMSEWKIKKPALKCDLLCVNPNDNLGTFVGILESDNKVIIIVYTLEADNSQLEKALIETSKIRWDASPIFEAILQKHSQTLEKVMRIRGKIPKLYCNSTLYIIRSEDAAKFPINIPENVYISELNLSDVDYMYSIYPCNNIYSKHELIDAINYNRSVGIYSKADGRLLSWATHTHYGGLGTLQTRKGEEGKGYARLTVQYLSKELAKIGIDIHATIGKENVVSRKVFESLGFEFKSPLTFQIPT